MAIQTLPLFKQPVVHSPDDLQPEGNDKLLRQEARDRREKLQVSPAQRGTSDGFLEQVWDPTPGVTFQVSCHAGVTRSRFRVTLSV